MGKRQWTRRGWLAAAGATLAVGTAGCSGTTDDGTGDGASSAGADSPFSASTDAGWPMYKATPERNPYHSGTSGLEGPVELTWSVQKTGTPSVSDDTVYLDAGPKMYGLDLASGDLEWEREATEGQLAPIVADDRIYTFDGGGLTALDAADGTRLWTEEGISGGFPTVRDGVIYGANDEDVFAYDPEAREMRWTAQSQLPDADDWSGIAQIAVGLNRIYTLAINGTVQAYDIETGEHQWVRGFSYLKGDVVFSVAHGLVYLAHGGNDSVLRAMDGATGEDRWTKPIGNPEVGHTVTEDRLYVTLLYEDEGIDPTVALDPLTGERLEELSAIDQMWGHQPVVANDTLYHFTANEVLQAVDVEADEVRWEYGVEGGLYTDALIVVEEAVCIHSPLTGGSGLAVLGPT